MVKCLPKIRVLKVSVPSSLLEVYEEALCYSFFAIHTDCLTTKNLLFGSSYQARSFHNGSVYILLDWRVKIVLVRLTPCRKSWRSVLIVRAPILRNRHTTCGSIVELKLVSFRFALLSECFALYQTIRPFWNPWHIILIQFFTCRDYHCCAFCCMYNDILKRTTSMKYSCRC